MLRLVFILISFLLLGAAGVFLWQNYSKENFYSTASLVENLPADDEESSELEKGITGELMGEEDSFQAEPEIESESEKEVDIESGQEQILTLAEIQEQIDDVSERIDMISQEVDDLVKESGDGNESEQGLEKDETEEVEEKLEEEIAEDETLEEEEEIEESEETEEQSEPEIEQKIEPQVCQKIEGIQPVRSNIVISEVTWMGSINSANDEWIELKNISGSEINLSGWQILDKEGKIKIFFSDKNVIQTNGLFLLERTDDNSVLDVAADLIYAGALNNDNENLYLFNGNCRLEDEAGAESGWSAGDNNSKRTMERRVDLSWQTSANSGGTPKRENSSGYYEYSASGGGGAPAPISVEPPPAQPPPKILITEIQLSSSSNTVDEFIELYNPNNEEVDLSQWSIQKSYSTSTTIYKKNFEDGNKIPALGYFLIINASATDQDLLNLTDLAHKTFSLSENNTIYLTANQDKIEGDFDTDIIDKVGFGENVFSEGNSAQNPPDGQSLGRKFSTSSEDYIDTDDNQLDFEVQEQSPKEKNKQKIESVPEPENQKPIASFNFSPQDPFIGEEILFDAASSSDSDGTITAFIWDFGDDNLVTTIQATTSHNFSTSTEFLITLLVVDNSGATSSPVTATISVAEKIPEAPVALSVVINEIAWMGTSATNSSDEWIEFYNNTDQLINIKDWSIYGADTGKCLNFSDADGSSTTIILPLNYLIYANSEESLKSSDDLSIVDVWDASIGMNNSSPGQLILYNVLNCLGEGIDIINQASEDWFAGDNSTKKTMERIDSLSSGSDLNNWGTSTEIGGTPKSKNSVSF